VERGEEETTTTTTMELVTVCYHSETKKKHISEPNFKTKQRNGGNKTNTQTKQNKARAAPH